MKVNGRRHNMYIRYNSSPFKRQKVQKIVCLIFFKLYISVRTVAKPARQFRHAMQI